MPTIPSINMLPMKEIKEELSKDFAPKNEKAIDTLNVSGIKSERIAVCYDYTENIKNPDGVETFSDRETIKNALFLDKIPASEYALKKDIEVNQQSLEETYEKSLEEPIEIKDELYQLYQILIEKGIIDDVCLYSGFQDYFLKNQINYLIDENKNLIYCKCNETMDTTVNIDLITLDVANFISENEFFTIKICSYQNQQESIVSEKIYKAINVTNENGYNAFNFCEVSTNIKTAISALLPEQTIEIGKVKGQYKDKTFSFSTSVTTTSDMPHSTAILDYDIAIDKTISSPYSGYATNIKIKEEVIGFKPSGYIQSFSLVGAKQGAPGSLRAYIIAATNLSSISDIQNIESNHKDLIIGKSNIINASNVTGDMQFITFKFEDESGKYPVLEKDQNYVFLITALGNVDEYNCWKIRFGASANNSDLHSSRTAYVFHNSALIPCTFEGDLLSYLVMYEKLDAKEVNFTNGLYTSKDFSLEENSSYKKIRASLRVLKETTFTTTNTTMKYYAAGDLIELANAQHITNLRSGDQIIIDHKIRTIKEVVSGEILRVSLTEPIILGASSLVYKNNYKVNSKLYQYVVSDNKEVSTNSCVIPLEFKEVKEHFDSNSVSDVLIYEAAVPTDFTKIDGANIQVAWSTDLQEAYGRIYDLSVFFVKGSV